MPALPVGSTSIRFFGGVGAERSCQAVAMDGISSGDNIAKISSPYGQSDVFQHDSSTHKRFNNRTFPHLIASLLLSLPPHASTLRAHWEQIEL